MKKQSLIPTMSNIFKVYQQYEDSRNAFIDIDDNDNYHVIIMPQG